MEKNVRYFEVELGFLAPTGAVVPITAASEDEAREIALHLFKDYNDLTIKRVTDISTETNQPPLLN